MCNRGHVTSREWRRVVVFAVVVMLVTTLPYVVGWLAADGEWTFSGFVFGADDGNSYLAKMRLGARGDWLFTIRYTHEDHGGALLFLPYILLGKLAGLIVGADSPDLVPALVVMFHAARIVFGFTLVLVSYRFVAVFLPRPATRMTALILIALGGGVGWLLALAGQDDLLGSLPVDFYVPEAYGFLLLFGLPHLALARAALLLGLLLMFRALEVRDDPRVWLRWTLPAGILWTVMGLCVPFYVAVLYLLLGVWGLAAWARWRRFPWGVFWRTASAAVVPLPLLAYTALVFLDNDVLRRWSAQNNLPSPHPLHYVLGYVAYMVPALVALRWAWRRGGRMRVDQPYLLLAAWVVVVPVMVYLPVNVQRRLAEGVIVPLSILAAAGLRLWFPHGKRWRRARAVLLVLALPTAALLLLGASFSAAMRERPLFHAAAETHAMQRLNAVAPQDAVVLSTKETGNYLPVYTDLVAYAGHGPETLHLDRKNDQIEHFYSGTLSLSERRDLLAQVDYVYVGPLERDLMQSDSGAWVGGLRLVPGFAPGDSVVVYEVVDDAN